MQVESLRTALKTYFPEHDVRYIFNRGGFVNYSFELTDGRSRHHLKITQRTKNLDRFQTWYTVHSTLELHYHAPRLLRWMDFPEIGFAGFLSEFVEGEVADFRKAPELLNDVIATVDRLHDDQTLAAQLCKHPCTYRDSFIETYINRFTADLESVGSRRPDFVSEQLFHWMGNETKRLAEIASRSPTFAQPAKEPIHGDLHENNFIVGPSGWYLLDWDDLALGDPALDFVILTWPIIRDGSDWPFPLDERLLERSALYRRAQLLDSVIDPLADYVDAPPDLDNIEAIRAAKRLEHEQSLDQYRQRFEL